MGVRKDIIEKASHGTRLTKEGNEAKREMKPALEVEGLKFPSNEVSLSAGAFPSPYKLVILSSLKKTKQSLLLTSIPLPATAPFLCSTLQQKPLKESPILTVLNFPYPILSFGVSPTSLAAHASLPFAGPPLLPDLLSLAYPKVESFFFFSSLSILTPWHCHPLSRLYLCLSKVCRLARTLS